MPSLPYNENLPNPPDDPSADVASMQINAQSVNTILSRDLYTFGATNAGLHQQVTFPLQVSQIAPIDPIAKIYTTTGIASSVSDLRYINQNGIFPISCIRAFGNFSSTTTPSTYALNNSFNVTGNLVTYTAGQLYKIPISANALTGTSICVLLNVSSDAGLVTSWSYAAPTLTISFGNVSGRTCSFVILQA